MLHLRGKMHASLSLFEEAVDDFTLALEHINPTNSPEYKSIKSSKTSASAAMNAERDELKSYYVVLGEQYK